MTAIGTGKKAMSGAKKDTKLNLSVCILTRNDESLLEDCIKSIQAFAREIIIGDLGSTDSTVNIARKYTNRIFRIEWTNNYSEARNNILRYASSDWILSLDAFERISPESQKLINNDLLGKKSNIAFLLKVHEMFQDKEVEHYSCRIFRRSKNIRFKRALQENVVEDVQSIARKDKLKIVPTDIVINRMVYLKYFDEAEIHKENIEITEKALENKKLPPTSQLHYKLLHALSLSSLGERADAEQEMTTIFEELKKYPVNELANIPLFMQPFLYFCFKYSKDEQYEKSLKVMEEGLKIYPESLTMIVRYAEQLYVNKEYKKCLDNIVLIKYLIQEEKYYPVEAIDFNMIQKLANKLENLAMDKLEKEEEKVTYQAKDLL